MRKTRSISICTHSTLVRLVADSHPRAGGFDLRCPLAEEAGFEETSLDLEARTRAGSSYNEESPEWGKFIKRSGNPKIPTLEEAMDEALTPEERERFASHLRPLVEGGKQRTSTAAAYLWATKKKEA